MSLVMLLFPVSSVSCNQVVSDCFWNIKLTYLLTSLVPRYLPCRVHACLSMLQENALVKNLNISLAFFVNSCLSLMDRSFIFQVIKFYCSAVSGTQSYYCRLWLCSVRCFNSTNSVSIQLAFISTVRPCWKTFPKNKHCRITGAGFWEDG